MSASGSKIERGRFTTRSFVPEDITQLLGASPTHSVLKGQQTSVSPTTGEVAFAKAGMWRPCAKDREPEDIDGQIREIFSQIPSDVDVWQNLTKEYRVNLFCGLFMTTTNDGLSISPQSMAILAERGVELWFDIYAPDEDGNKANT